MPAVKAKRQSSAIDMTAMCDVGFLLLTFFMLTAKFRPDEKVMIDVPNSVSQTQIENAVVVSVDKTGKAYIYYPDELSREKALEYMVATYPDKYAKSINALTPEQKKKFTKIDVWGAPVENMPQILSLSSDEFRKLELPGIPLDSINDQLGDFVNAGRYAIQETKGTPALLAIKGDKYTDIDGVKKVIECFRRKDLLKFNLITSLAGAEDKK